MPHSSEPRVLYLTDLSSSKKFGSMEEQIFAIANTFRDRGGVFVPVFGRELLPRVRDQYAAAGLAVEGLNLHELSLSSVRRLLDLIRRYDIGILHWNFYSPINPYVWILSMLAPRLVHYRTDHNSRPLEPEEFSNGAKALAKRKLFTRYRKVFGVSDYVVSELARSGMWPDASRISYFVNTDRFAPNAEIRAATRAQHAAGAEFVILFVGQVIRDKGCELAVEAMTSLPETTVLWLIGEGRDRERLQKMATTLGVGHRVRFMGQLWNVEPFMQGADCLVCPSLWEEAAGLVNLEALATGIPVVASSVGGIPEIVKDGETGLLFAAGDRAAMVNCIQRLERDREFAARLGRNGRKDALERFSIERGISEHVRVYDN